MATEEIENLYKELTSENGSAAAAPSFSQEWEKNYKNTLDNALQQKWYHTGKRAKQRGYGDFSPFYENATADYFFKCGYDNVPFVEAQQVLKEKIEQELKANPLVRETVVELTRENTIDHLYVPEDQL